MAEEKEKENAISDARMSPFIAREGSNAVMDPRLPRSSVLCVKEQTNGRFFGESG